MTSLKASFDPRSNSIGFLRWLMAFMVIFSHAGPSAGFYGGHDLGTQWSDEQSLGGVAPSPGSSSCPASSSPRARWGARSTPRYFWRRIMRIFPGWFLILLVTAFVFAPIAWVRETGSIDGFWDATVDSPLTYFSNNMWLPLNQHGIAGMGTSDPLLRDPRRIRMERIGMDTRVRVRRATSSSPSSGVVGALSNRLVGGDHRDGRSSSWP